MNWDPSVARPVRDHAWDRLNAATEIREDDAELGSGHIEQNHVGHMNVGRCGHSGCKMRRYPST